MSNYNRGNEWLKWDLHLHCPGTIFNNQYKGKNDDEIWNRFFNMIEKSDISVLGITDYYSIEGYKKVKDYKNKGHLKNIKAIFPNIELRLDKGAKNNKFVNYHIIFSPEVDKYIEEYFIRKLTFTYASEKYNYTKDEIIKLGKKVKGPNYKEPFVEGTNLFKANLNNINQILNDKKIFKGKFFTVVSGSDKDGVDIFSDNQGNAVRNDILCHSDGVFATNEKVIDKYLLKDKDSDKNKRNMINVGCPKPCFQGSDSHGFKQEFGKKWTWIKAEPSFNGLLQTKFEPERRVKESKYHQNSPIKINSNQWIKSIDLGNNKTFQNKVVFNPGLNAIIGGKSSGKSILLYKIAEGGGEKNFEKIRNFKDYDFNKYKGLNNILPDKPKLTLGNGNDIKGDFKVDYYPQLFINRISENYKNDELQRIIINIFKENKEIFPKIDNFREWKDDIREKLSNQLECCKRIVSKIDALKEGKRQLGNINDLKQSLDDENSKYESLKRQISLNSHEKCEYSKYIDKLNELKKDKDNIEKSLDKIRDQEKSINDFINKIENDFVITIRETEIKDLLRPDFNNYKDSLNKIIEDSNKTISDLNKKMEKNKKDTDILSKQYDPLLQKISRKDELRECENSKNQIQMKISEYSSKEKEIKDMGENLENIFSEGIEKNIEDFIDKAKKNADIIDDKEIGTGLSLNTKLMFNQEKYHKEIINKFDGRSLQNIFCNGIIEDLGEISIDKFPSSWTEIIRKTFNHQFDSKLKQNVETNELANSLKELPIEMPININKENDDLSIMSPGKRAIVLLELLLENDSSNTSPILIDQPEDNLDNRSISNELVNLLKKVSLKRQVIIVTHNANLVVLADADEVIVANQDPEIVENEKYRFEYISGSLESSEGYTENDKKLSHKGIRYDITDILEGGIKAFKTRERKYLLD